MANGEWLRRAPIVAMLRGKAKEHADSADRLEAEARECRARAYGFTRSADLIETTNDETP